jgi:hypothetical protein
MISVYLALALQDDLVPMQHVDAMLHHNPCYFLNLTLLSDFLCALPLCLQDDLVPVPHVDAMLCHDVPSACIMHHPAMAHADFLFSPDWQDQIISHVAEVGLGFVSVLYLWFRAPPSYGPC